MTTRTLLFLTVFAAAAPAAPAADRTVLADRTYRLEWQELIRVTRGRRVELTLPSGIRLRGAVIAVEPDELVLDVRKTSDKHAFPKGRNAFPRADVTRLRVRQNARYTWRGVGLGIGAACGTLAGIGVAAVTGNAGAVALSVAIPAGLGYLLGWAGDYPKEFDVIVEPGPKAAPDPGSL